MAEDETVTNATTVDLDETVARLVRGLCAALVMPWALQVAGKGQRNLNSYPRRREQMLKAAALCVAVADALLDELGEDTAEGWAESEPPIEEVDDSDS